MSCYLAALPPIRSGEMGGHQACGWEWESERGEQRLGRDVQLERLEWAGSE